MKKDRRDFIKKTSAMAALSVAGIGTASGKLLNSEGFVLNSVKKVLKSVNILRRGTVSITCTIAM